MSAAMEHDQATPVIAIIGGTGQLGLGLGLRWAQAGRAIIVGSRRAESATEAARSIEATVLERTGQICAVKGAENLAAAEAAEIVVLTVPYAQHEATLAAIAPMLAGKILIDATVPLMPPKVGTVQLPTSGSAAVSAQTLLGEGVKVISAFQNIAAAKLQSDEPLDCDVLVSGNDKEAREAVLGLVKAAGMQGYHAGPLANSAAAEALTSVLITINRQYKCHAGIRIVGLD